MRRISCAALVLGLLLSAPASAQNSGAAGGGYGGFGTVGGGPDYGGPPVRRLLSRPPSAGVACVTPRGTCRIDPAPRGAPCACRSAGRNLPRGTVR